MWFSNTATRIRIFSSVVRFREKQSSKRQQRICGVILFCFFFCSQYLAKNLYNVHFVCSKLAINLAGRMNDKHTKNGKSNVYHGKTNEQETKRKLSWSIVLDCMCTINQNGRTKQNATTMLLIWLSFLLGVQQHMKNKPIATSKWKYKWLKCQRLT